MIVNQKSPKVSGCLVCGYRTEEPLKIEMMKDYGCPICPKEMRSLFIECREWFDNVNGNSYFSARIWINGKVEIVLPFQYGYERHFETVAVHALIEKGFISEQYKNCALWVVANEMQFDLYTSKAHTTKKEMFKESN